MENKKAFFIDSLDGIRAVAFFIVFISHCGAEKFIPGGFGVTIFFYLSGYLITTLLRLEFEKNKEISLKKFYLRRAFRIFPLQYFALTVAYILVYCEVLSGKPGIVSIVMQFFQLTNYLTMNGTGMVPFGTGIFWSLSVEEHFYLLFPLVFIYLIRNYSYKTITLVFIAMCGIILFWRMILILKMPDGIERIYRGTDTRIDSILLGCVLAMFYNPKLDDIKIPYQTVVVSCIFSLAILIFTFVFKNSFFRETYRYTLQGIALFPLFYAAVKYPAWWCFKPLNLKFIRYLGTLSFGMYLVHFMLIFIIEKYFEINIWALRTLITLVTTILVAHLLHITIEKPLLTLRKKWMI